MTVSMEGPVAEAIIGSGVMPQWSYKLTENFDETCDPGFGQHFQWKGIVAEGGEPRQPDSAPGLWLWDDSVASLIHCLFTIVCWGWHSP